MNTIGIPRALPPPVDFYRTFTPPISSIKTSKKTKTGVSKLKSKPKPKPKPILADFFNTVNSRIMSSSTSSAKKVRPIKTKCPKGTRKNRKTKVCETHSQILFRTRREYRKGAYKKCSKGTRRNKVTNNCDPK
jgi:hypothetical protein